MDCFAAVITGTGTGAIATIQVFGDSARAIVETVFKPAGTKPAQFKTGHILLGDITDDGKTIDQVTIGCEAPGIFAIHCHGNPLIVEMIMQRLQSCGASLLTPEQLRTKILTAQQLNNTIAVEATLAQLKAKNLKGTKILANQIEVGLCKKTQDWLSNIDSTSLDNLKAEAVRILHASRTAKLIISGCKAVLTGPPNSGKSTLLNCLAGRQKAIVTDIKGTTRDWIEATCRIGSLSLTLIDTAGLEEELGDPKDTVEKAAQKKTVEVLEQADLILLVLDNSEPFEKSNIQSIEKITNKKIITILNKSDLPSVFDTTRLPEMLTSTLLISAKNSTGIENLKQKILQTSDVTKFDLHQPICFADRQEKLLKQLANVQSKHKATLILRELRNGQVQTD